MNLKIKKDNLYKYVFFLLYMPLFVRFFTDNFGLTYVIMPVFDIVLYLLLVFIIYLNKKNTINELNKTWFFFVLFILIALTSIIVNEGTRISDLFYQVRPYFRMIAMVIASAYVLKFKDLEKIYKFIKYLLYFNFVIMFFQYTFWGLRQDIIGGTFGNTQGVNSIQNVLCIFLFTTSIIKYLYKDISLMELFINSIVVLMIAILAEINLLLFEIAFSAIIAIILNSNENFKLSLRKLFLIFAGFFILIFAINLFLKYNEDRAFLFSIDNILEYLGANENSTGVYKISRVRVFSQLGNKFFKNDISKWLFGFGLGNCSTHTSFYDNYNYLQYDYFSSSFVFLETGLLGVILNLAFFVYIFYKLIKQKKKSADISMKIWNNVGIIFSILSFVLFFYNSSLRDVYTAFWLGMLCSIMFIIEKEKVDDSKKNSLYLARK